MTRSGHTPAHEPIAVSRGRGAGRSRIAKQVAERPPQASLTGRRNNPHSTDGSWVRSSRGGSTRPVGLHGCSLMRDAVEASIRIDAHGSRAAGRRRRLSRGVDRWIQSTLHSTPPRQTVWLLLFTTAGDIESVQGRIRDFWHAYRDRVGRRPYFAWLELTRAGRPHYHAMLLDPGMPRNGETKRWLEQAWGMGFVKIEVRPRSWFTERAGAYVGKYAKKIGNKSYQQDYSEVPREIRTFVTNRMAHTQAELREHESRWIVVHVPHHFFLREYVPEHVSIIGRREHVVHTHCTLPNVRPRPPGGRGRHRP
jgi:hypothetical protein